MTYRKTPQPLLPKNKPDIPDDVPDIYPTYPIVSGQITPGYESLAEHFNGQSLVLIDGYGGVLWDRLRAGLEGAGVKATWISMHDLMKADDEINGMVEPFLGGDDPIFGTRYTGTLKDFFDVDKLNSVDLSGAPTIVYGEGALLASDGGYRVYVDLPKNEVQYRSRAGSITNLGVATADTPKRMYKRFYFVDWVALNRHKADIVAQIDLFVDGQDADHPALLAGDDVRATFARMGKTVFRVRPWFEPGAWGGQWIKSHIPGLADDVPNYAWSFEMIAPEQGLILNDSGHLLELSFDWLMYHDHQAILGDYASNFGYEFPIRFDFLDTMDGGNLSVQCHPRPAFMRENFGELFTQDETYYIFEAGDDAKVYLGFQEGIDPDEFRTVLEESVNEVKEVDIEQYVQVHPAQKGDLFLIPNGTVHCSGQNTMVLEISATPYIFTFKMYDWLRLDLDGKPRPINIERAFDNLYFDRQGDMVTEQLISQPRVIRRGDDWTIEHLPTHPEHFYDVHRLRLNSSLDCQTEGSVQVLMVTEGDGVYVETEGLPPVRYNYAETFIVPASTGTYRLQAIGDNRVTVIQSFLRRTWFEQEENQWLKAKL